MGSAARAQAKRPGVNETEGGMGSPTPEMFSEMAPRSWGR